MIKDIIALPTKVKVKIAGLLLIALVVGSSLGSMSTYEFLNNNPESLPIYVTDNNELAVKIDKLYRENEKLEKELKEYICLKTAIKKFGATDEQAKCVIKVSDEVGIRPKNMGL